MSDDVVPGESPAPTLTPRHWPGAERAPLADLVGLTCQQCKQAWLVHRDLGGFQITCDCGSRALVPALARASNDALPASVRPRYPTRFVRPDPGDDDPDIIPVLKAPERAAANNRAIIELILIMLALVGPIVAVNLAWGAQSAPIALPFVSLIAGGLVLLLGLSSAQFAFGGLVPTQPRYFIEALLTAAVCALLAYGYLHALPPDISRFDSLEQRLLSDYGIVVLLFTIAVCPAVFEEIAFRGMLQGRLTATFGRGLALPVTSATFAVCHGVTLGLPFHFGVGLLLGWLRIRSKSLLPGMVLHFTYNALVCLI